jgi:hypothetical protein
MIGDEAEAEGSRLLLVQYLSQGEMADHARR